MGYWQDKGVGFLKGRGSSQKRVVTDERDGSVAGVEHERWDGSQDATVRPKPIHVKAKRIDQ